MSDVIVEGQNASNPEGGEKAMEQMPNVDATELMTRLDRLESSNKRLLDESKAWKSKYQSVRTEVEEKESETLKQSNDFKGLYERTLAQVDELKSDLTDVKRSSLDTALKYEVAKNGNDAEDVEILLAAVKTKKRDLLSYDREESQWKGVDMAIEELRKSNSGLFKSTIPGMENGRPQSAVPKDKTVDDLINEDPMAVFREAIAKTL